MALEKIFFIIDQL